MESRQKCLDPHTSPGNDDVERTTTLKRLGRNL